MASDSNDNRGTSGAGQPTGQQQPTTDARGTSGSKPAARTPATDEAARLRHHVDQDGPKVRMLGELTGDFYNGLLSKGVPETQASFITQEYVRQFFEDGRRERDRASGWQS